MALNKKSISELKSIAENGDPHAALMLARAYKEGNGVLKDNNEAINWFKKAAVLSNWSANFELSIIYRDGLLDQEIDMDKAKYHLTEAERITRENNR